MKCPRCETALLEEKERDGITIDICRQCRGVWLDRGELERLIAHSAEEQQGYGSDHSARHDGHLDQDSHHHDKHHHDKHYDKHRHEYPDGRYRRKRGFLESLTDIFD